ncbi:GDSL-type esterase/lipase family protein [Lachnospiraceae bacterium 46-15]
MKGKKCKRILSLVLAGVLAVTGAGISGGRVQAAERVSRGASMEEGLSYGASDFSGTSFNGTNVFSVSESDANLLKENLRSAIGVDISITFKPTSLPKNFINLLEIYDKDNNSSSESGKNSSIAVIVSKSGTVYVMSGSMQGSTDWAIATGQNLSVNTSYTLNLSISGTGARCSWGSGNEWSAPSGTTKGTKDFFGAFFGGTSANYTDWRTEIDAVAIGGLSADSYHKHTNFGNLNGEVTAVTVSGVSERGDATGMFAADKYDNTWLFGGGVETQGRFEEVGGVRNFIGQFEEYVRWVKRVDGVVLGMQRYTINAGKTGQDAAAFAAKLDSHISKLDPMAVSYLVGPEDYCKGAEGIEAFKSALTQIITKALALKHNEGFAVIQLPHAVKDAEAAANVSLYAAAAREAVQTASPENRRRIIMVDHLSRTNTDDFKNTMLTEDGLLNAAGHYEIAKQFSADVYGQTAGFPTLQDWSQTEAPDTWLSQMPGVAASADSLEVTIPQGIAGTEWKYILEIDGMEISGLASGNPFTIRELPREKEYTLTVRTQDGTAQLAPVAGRIVEGNQAAAAETERTGLQAAIRAKADDKTTPLTWLFMGDSITHAAQHTGGHDGIAQLFEKYVKEDLGRVDDIVVNTAVSGATAARTLEHIEQRMTKYCPDIVSIMLGTNDAINDTYQAQLKQIVAKIREVNPAALIIFRSPTPGTGNWGTKLPGETGSVARMRAVAEEDGNILFIDQWTGWQEEIDVYPYLMNRAHYFGDGTVHPGAAGHARMTRQFIRECGLDTNTRIANLEYQFAYEDVAKDAAPIYMLGENSIMLDKEELQKLYGEGTLGDVRLTAAEKISGKTYSIEGKGEEIKLDGLPTDRMYHVEVSALVKGNTAKRVNFATQDVELKKGQVQNFVVTLSNRKLRETAAGTEVGNFEIKGKVPEGTCTYMFVDGNGAEDNNYFEIADTTLKVKKALNANRAYSIRVRGQNGEHAAEGVFVIQTMPTLKSVRMAAKNSFETDKMALDLDLSDVIFDGTNVVDLGDANDSRYMGGAYIRVMQNLREHTTGGTIIYRFKTTQTVGTTIWGAGGNNTAAQSSDMVYGLAANGKFRASFRTETSGLRGELGSAVNDGAWHTVAMSFDTTREDYQGQIRVSIDGGSDIMMPEWWRDGWQSWFNKTDSDITSFVVGGGKYTGFAYGMTNAFNGQVSFITITDDVCTEEELMALSGDRTENTMPGDMSISGKQPITIQDDGKVSLPSDACMNAEMKWDEKGETAEIILTPNGNAVIDAEAIDISVVNAAKLGFDEKATVIEFIEGKVVIKLTKKVSQEAKELQDELSGYVSQYADKIQKDSEKYTEESWSKFVQAYNVMKRAVEEDEKDTELLKEYRKVFLEAEQGLVLREPDPGPNPDNPNPDNPNPGPKPNPGPVPEPTPGHNDIREGNIYESKGYLYKVTSLSKRTVAAVGMKGSFTKIVVPDTVAFESGTYKVTGIGALAFKNNKKAVSITVGKNVVKIGSNAFAGCKKLRKAVLNSTALKQLGGKAFYNCKKLKSIVIKSARLKKAGKNAFKGIYKKAVIKVPKKKYKAYTKLLKKKGQGKGVKIKK